MDLQPAGSATILQFLSSLPLFEGVSQVGLAALARDSHWKRVPRVEFIFFQTDPTNAVYLVRRGAIAIRLENPDGRELIINEMNRGDFFGELGILTGEPRSTSAQAIVDSEVLLIPGAAFLEVLKGQPPLMLHLLELIARRLQHSTEREEALAFQDAQQRVARLLLQLDKLASDKGYLTLSQDELARRAGLTRQTVATILGRWRRRGWLLTGRGNIVLLNRGELKSLVQSGNTLEQY